MRILMIITRVISMTFLSEEQPILTHAQGKRRLDVTRVVIGAFFECYNQLGKGFLESVYEAGLALILEDAGLDVRRQERITVWFRGRQIGRFRAGLVVNNTVLVEIKRAKRILSSKESC